MRIANVDMSNNHSQCPPGLVYNVTEGRRLCRKPSLAPGCSSTTFSTQGVDRISVLQTKCRAAGTGQAGQAKTGPLFWPLDMVLVVTSKVMVVTCEVMVVK